MILKYLIDELTDYTTVGDENIKINGIEYMSKNIKEGDIFVAIKGFHKDGKDYITEAIEKGAKVIILDKDCKQEEKQNITYVYVNNSRVALAKIAAKFYDFPNKKLNLFGVTGTKGKTTTVYMIYEILKAAGKKVGMIGTIYTKYDNVKIDSSRTTPESLDIYKTLKMMLDKGIENVVIEVSSHALELSRLEGLRFNISVFTNLSTEHLDFHETMDNYLNAKAKLFDMSDFAVINGDDLYYNQLSKIIKCKIATYGLDNKVNITATDLRINGNYTEFKMFVNKMLQTIIVNIPGRFTVYNSLAAIGVCSMLNIQMDAILLGLMNVKVPGRNEVVDIKKTFTAIVDYAHTPASLEAILVATKKYAKGRIILVFGCGGNRDKSKRELMGEIAGKYANFTCITSDNPRDEKEETILSMIEEGMKKTNGLYKVIKDRREAIKFAMRVAWKNDIVIVAGKGHETYQIFRNNKKVFFDDREVIKDIASKMPDKNLEENNQ